MLNRQRLSKLTALFFSIVLAGVIIISGSRSSTAESTNNQAVAQGYVSVSNLQPGMIVNLSTQQKNQVEALTQANITKMLGVVITASDAALTLGQNNVNQQVFVASFGQHDVLVSNQDGPVTVGDYITISSVAGIGMKANNSQSVVLGQAAGNFNGTNSVETTSLVNSSGNKTNIAIGLIPVDISVAGNPLEHGPSGVPTFLKNITKFATNKSVSALRVYISMLIVLAGVVLTVTIIYAGVKNGIISLGRNPLAKKVIGGGMVRIVLLAIIIFAISLAAAYGVLI